MRTKYFEPCFDTQENKQVDVRELGTVIRSLGLCPTEAEVNEIIAETEDETATGYVRLDRLLPVMTKVLLEKKFRSQPEPVLLQAFETLDIDKKGYLLPGKSISVAHRRLLQVRTFRRNQQILQRRGRTLFARRTGRVPFRGRRP